MTIKLIKMRWLYLMFISFSMIVSCRGKITDKSNSSDTPFQMKGDTILTTTRSEQYSQAEIGKMLDSSIKYGNQMAYSKVSSYYSLNLIGEDFLYYALIMANRYHEPAAYNDIFQILTLEDHEQNLKNLDSTTRAIALYSLLRAYELGDRSSKYTVGEIFTDHNKPIPKSSDYIVFKKFN